MIDIVVIAQSVFQVHIIVNGSQDILSGDVFRDQVMDISSDGCLDVFEIVIFFQNFLQYRVIY